MDLNLDLNTNTSAAFAADDDAPVVAMVADDIARSWSDMVDQYQGGKQQQLPDGSLLFPADLMLVMQRHSEDDVVNALRQAQRRDEEAKQQADGKDVLVFLEKELEFIEPDAAGSKDFGDADASFQEPEGKGVVVVLEKDNLPESRRQDDLSSILALFESMGLTGSSATSTTSTTTAAPPPEQSPDAGNAELLDVLRLIDTGALGTLESMDDSSAFLTSKQIPVDLLIYKNKE
ncbi:hypothetical protein FOCC_FOCC009407 [Frankliniella occidentalis]|nr:hypothetical protein FOCC_FOCC009407 [Frankliniella occidentalis]